MPELPEVETVIRGLSPQLTGATIIKVKLNRSGLRFDFAKDFASNLQEQTIIALNRRAKYLIFALDNGKKLLSHLGMSGNFTIVKSDTDLSNIKHCHVEFLLKTKNNEIIKLIYTDPRRFGFMDIFEHEENCKFLHQLGVEPLSNHFNAKSLANKFQNKRTPIKSALLNQKIIAGLGNIYVCEALWIAKINPKTPIKQLVNKNGTPSTRLEILVPAIIDILNRAIRAGGSTLNDFHDANGQSGYFQHSFDVYGREGEQCNNEKCNAKIIRISQAGRSTFYCPKCQKTNQ